MIKLVPLDTADYPCWWLDEEVSENMIHGSCTRGPDYNKEYYESIKKDPNTKVWKIMADDKHIGNISISHIDWIHRRGELGIVIWDKKCHGKGVGTEAVKQMCKWCFSNLNLNSVWLGVIDRNRGAIRCYEKAGFVKCGREHRAVFRKGEWLDIVKMELINDPEYMEVLKYNESRNR